MEAREVHEETQVTESWHRLLAVKGTYFTVLHPVLRYLKWACPLVSGKLKGDLTFIGFVSQWFFSISSGAAAALRSVTCQVKPKQEPTSQTVWLLRG